MRLSEGNYFGCILKERKTENFVLSITAYQDACKVPLHYHQNPYLSLNLRSKYLEQGEFMERTVGAGNIVIRPKGYEHENVFYKKNGLCFNIEILKNPIDSYESLFDDVVIKSVDRQLQKLLVGFVINFQEDELDCMITEALIPINGEVFQGKKQDWYFRVLDHIHDEYDAYLSLQTLSETANIHPVYLARKFKALKGMTVGEYIRKVRAEKGFTLLTSSSIKLTEIGLQSGYYDQSHFSRSFRQTFGLNPRQWRSSLQRLI